MSVLLLLMKILAEVLMRGGPLFPDFKILIVFPSWYCLHIKGRFYIKCWNVFWCHTCGNRCSFTKSKMKNYYLELLIAGYKFARCESKSSGQKTAASRIFLWKVAIPYFWETNDWVKITSIAWCCALNCYKDGNRKKVVQAI